MFAAVLLAVRSRQLFRYRQVPLPDALVWRRTLIRRDWRAIVEAYSFLAVASIFAVALIYVWVHLEVWNLFKRNGA
jgi:hypothetical protein